MNRFAKTLFRTGIGLIVVAAFIFMSVPTNFSRMDVRPADETQAQIDAEDRATAASNRREVDFVISVAAVTGGIGVVGAIAGAAGQIISKPGKLAWK